MKKFYLIIILIIVIVGGIYLNRAYAFIYNEIHNGNLTNPNTNEIYMLSDNKNNKTLTYVALGDSLTAGAGVENAQQSYPYLVAQKLGTENNVTLKNRSQLGYKTEDLKNVLLPTAITDNPNIITLLIGVNDIHNNVSAQKFSQNYEQILQSLTTNTKAKIYLISIPYIGSANLILPPYNYYFNSKTKEFNKIIKNLAQKYNLKYINIYSATQEEFTKSDTYYSRDLFHPSAKGYAVWANIIYANFN